MLPTVPAPEPLPYTICPKCGNTPERGVARTVRGITRATFTHGATPETDHVWIVEFVA